MITIVNTPSSVSTVSYRCLVAYTVYVVQPDLPGAWRICRSQHRSRVPEISNIGLIGGGFKHIILVSSSSVIGKRKRDGPTDRRHRRRRRGATGARAPLKFGK